MSKQLIEDFLTSAENTENSGWLYLKKGEKYKSGVCFKF